MAKGSRAQLLEVSPWFGDGNRLAAWVLSLTEVLAWYEAVVFTGFTLSQVDDGWRLVVKAERHKGHNRGEPVVAFVTAATAYDAFKVFASQVMHKQVSWKPDKYKQA